MKFLLWILAICFFSEIPTTAEAGSGKEFVTSIIYGTLAGTLVGAATLAFTSNPGDNLNNVARGASYGMYAGILLGVLASSGAPDSSPGDPSKELSPSQVPGTDPSAPGAQFRKLEPSSVEGFRFVFYPVARDSKSALGIGATLLTLRF